MIELIGNVDVADWWMQEKFEVNPNEIFGFEIDYRGSWHIIVKVKEKQRCKRSAIYPKGYYYLDYEIGNCVELGVIVDLIKNPEAKILEFSCSNLTYEFFPDLKWIMKSCLPNKDMKAKE